MSAFDDARKAFNSPEGQRMRKRAERRRRKRERKARRNPRSRRRHARRNPAGMSTLTKVAIGFGVLWVVGHFAAKKIVAENPALVAKVAAPAATGHYS